jgi:hypothetical protein
MGRSTGRRVWHRAAQGSASPRTVSQGAQAAANVGGVSVATGSGTYADYLALLRAKRDLQVAANLGAVHKPSALAAPAAAQQGSASQDVRGGHDIQLPTRVGGP